MNNGVKIDTEIISSLQNCSYVFKKNNVNKNTLYGLYNNTPVIAFSIDETKKKSDIYISIPKDILCEHYKDSKITIANKSTENTHLTYHGNSINKKHKQLKGELHLKLDNKVVLKHESNKLEAPISSSRDIEKYPLPLCRIELSDKLNRLEKDTYTNHFNLIHNDLFFNTLDIFIAKKGFFIKMITVPNSCPNFVATYLTNFTLEGCYTDNLVRRRGRYPQVLILEGNKLEIIIFNMIEAQNESYKQSKLLYQHSVNYIKELFDRDVYETEEGYFVAKDSKHSNYVNALNYLEDKKVHNDDK